MDYSQDTRIRCGPRLELTALPGLPLVVPGDDLATLALAGLERAGLRLNDGDVLVVTSKVVSRAEDRFVDLATVEPSARARETARLVQRDARFVELVLREARAISRQAPGVLVVRHRLGFVTANAGIDASNAAPPGATQDSGPWVLLLPLAPDETAERIRARLAEPSGARIGVVISDSLSRPFRLGTVGAAIGVAGMPALWDRRGDVDLHGRRLEMTVTALADQVAAAADLLAGQADEGRAMVHVRGLRFPTGTHRASELSRPEREDLYA